MALFPEMSTYYKGRTHTNLVVSEGMAPAERYIPSANELVKFQYNFGPEGNTGVVIPKGKAVAISGLEWDYETEKHVPALKIADGTSTDDIIGVNHHNVYERRRDRFSGNQPTIITREYIELPLFSSQEMATAIQFGAAWTNGGSSNDVANAIIGKYVAIDEHGNFTLAVEGTYDKIIGQCLGVETDLPPAGYLQYFMEMDDERWAEFQKQMSYAPSPGRTKGAKDDIGTYPLGTSYLKDRRDFLKNFKAGIPFLTDGYFKARTAETYTLASAGVTAKTAGHVEIAANKITVTDPVGAALFVKLPKADVLTNESVLASELKNYDGYADLLEYVVRDYPEFGNGPIPSGVIVKVGGTQVNPNNVHIDYTNNQIVIYLTEEISTAADIEIKAVVLQNQVPGIPTGWDFTGAYGAARILLSHK